MPIVGIKCIEALKGTYAYAMLTNTYMYMCLLNLKHFQSKLTYLLKKLE